jgi:predicted DNA-binding transcriptional regulator YafY
VKAPVWYLLTYDLDKAAARVFRMDRVRKPRLLTQVRFRPDPARLYAALPEGVAWKPLVP